MYLLQNFQVWGLFSSTAKIYESLWDLRVWVVTSQIDQAVYKGKHVPSAQLRVGVGSRLCGIWVWDPASSQTCGWIFNTTFLNELAYIISFRWWNNMKLEVCFHHSNDAVMMTFYYIYTVYHSNVYGWRPVWRFRSSSGSAITAGPSDDNGFLGSIPLRRWLQAVEMNASSHHPRLAPFWTNRIDHKSNGLVPDKVGAQCLFFPQTFPLKKYPKSTSK